MNEVINNGCIERANPRIVYMGIQAKIVEEIPEIMGEKLNIFLSIKNKEKYATR